MTDQTRNLLISLASHMAYMQGQLEARHELDDPEDYYWYRESVALRQKVTDALADGPAVPEGREPASVVSEPSDEDLLGIACQSIKPYDKIRPGEYEAETECVIEVYGSELVTFARAVLTRWGNPAPKPPAKGEVAELVEGVRLISDGMSAIGHDSDSWFVARAAELLQRLSPPQPVPVSERLPGDQLCWWYEPDEDDDGSGYGGNWTLLRIRGGVSCYTHWLPFTALPLPAGEGEP